MTGELEYVRFCMLVHLKTCLRETIGRCMLQSSKDIGLNLSNTRLHKGFDFFFKFSYF